MRTIDRLDPMLSALRPELAYQVRTAAVPLALRTIFERVPGRPRVRALVPRDLPSMPLGARQLLRLACQLERVALELEATAPGGALELHVELDGRSVCLADGLDGDLTRLALGAMSSLCDGATARALVESLAFSSSVLAALGTITRHMLAAATVDAALRVMLTGLTSGDALGLNRAALFAVEGDEAEAAAAVFRGVDAVGVDDAGEATRIWEAMELENVELDAVLERISRADAMPAPVPGPGSLARRIEALALAPGAAAGDELALLLRTGGPVRVTAHAVCNPGLAAIGLAEEFALALVRSGSGVLGVVVADNRFTAAPITDAQLAHLGLFVSQAALIWENRRLMARVAHQASHDALTGALNRRAFLARLEALDPRRRRDDAPPSGPLALLVLDVDHFKDVNDAHGHDVGDRTLVALVEALREALGPQGVIGRFGGDEFVAAVAGVDAQALPGLLARLGAAAAARGVGISVGAARRPDDGHEFGALFAAADRRLYRAKHGGRARGCLDDAGTLVALR